MLQHIDVIALDGDVVALGVDGPLVLDLSGLDGGQSRHERVDQQLQLGDVVAAPGRDERDDRREHRRHCGQECLNRPGHSVARSR